MLFPPSLKCLSLHALLLVRWDWQCLLLIGLGVGDRLSSLEKEDEKEENEKEGEEDGEGCLFFFLLYFSFLLL